MNLSYGVLAIVLIIVCLASIVALLFKLRNEDLGSASIIFLVIFCLSLAGSVACSNLAYQIEV